MEVKMTEHPLYPEFEKWYHSADNQVSRLAFKDELWRVWLSGAEANKNMQLSKQQEQLDRVGQMFKT